MDRHAISTRILSALTQSIKSCEYLGNRHRRSPSILYYWNSICIINIDLLFGIENNSKNILNNNIVNN
jgi:hypothetical protein